MRPSAVLPDAFARLLSLPAARPICAAVGGIAAFGLIMATVFTLDAPGRRPGRTTVDMVARPPVGATPTPVRPMSVTREDAHDAAAVAYYQARDRAAAVHVREVIWTPPILRVYTDLPGSEVNSRIAIALCRTAAVYLEGRGRAPVVFVHARGRDGYPVLANKMDSADGCRLGPVP